MAGMPPLELFLQRGERLLGVAVEKAPVTRPIRARGEARQQFGPRNPARERQAAQPRYPDRGDPIGAEEIRRVEHVAQPGVPVPLPDSVKPRSDDEAAPLLAQLDKALDA